jgi:hemerythrin-like domain-containing protein
MTLLTSLGQVLHEEHFRILVWICELQNRVCGEAAEQCFDCDIDLEQQEMHGVIGGLDHVLAHHAFEENVIFPLLRTDDDRDLVELLADEHQAIEPITKRLRMLTTEMLRHGGCNGRWSEFCRLAQELFAQMLRHLETEERIILQRLEHLLDQATDHRLALQHLSTRQQPSIAANTLGLS